MDVRGMEFTFPFLEQSPLYETKVSICTTVAEGY